MGRALQLARRGLYSTRPNPRVGCVLVANNAIIAEGWHEYAGGPHAEIRALEAAGERAEGATCYVTLEPCDHTGRTGPCSRALIQAGIGRVVAAMQDPNSETAGRGLQRLSGAGVQVDCGLLESQARRLNIGFIRRMTARRPFVRCKLAMSLDGRTAMASGESRWITSQASRLDVQRWRARSCAVVTGIGTVLADEPGLDVREIELQYGGPLRVVLDRRLRLSPEAAMLRRPGRVLVLTVNQDENKTKILNAAGADVRMLPRDNFLFRVLQCLADEGINEVLVEAGATLTGALLEQSLIDELIIYQAPVIMGNESRALFQLPALQKMTDRIPLTMIDMRRIGSDVRFIFNTKTMQDKS